MKEELSHEDFVRLLAMHSSRVMSFIRILTMNRQHDAEEIFQSTCMVMWQKFSTYESGNFAAWACSIARYETLKYRESKRRANSRRASLPNVVLSAFRWADR